MSPDLADGSHGVGDLFECRSIRRADDLAAVVAFFEARNGRLYGFRWKDWGDYKSCLPSEI